jgi:branched-chain amino acid transport system ATP-binding protein
MSVFENVLVCASYARGTSERTSYQRCVETLELTHLTDKANQRAGKLTLLNRKRLELARALAGDPTVLLLDEIAGGLTEVEVEELITTIRDLHAEGIAIVWIEHIVHALLETVDRIFAINFGRQIADGEPRQVMCSDEVQACYMGGTPL